MGKKRRRKDVPKALAVTANDASSQALMEWTVHLAPRYPFKAALTICVIVVTFAFGWVWANPLIAIAAGAFLLGAVSEFLFPVRYRLTAEGAEAVGFLFRRFVPWHQVHRLVLLANGIRLSPFRFSSPLEPFRSLTLHWVGDEKGLQRLHQLCEGQVKKAQSQRSDR